jgi:hypothetical protein
MCPPPLSLGVVPRCTGKRRRREGVDAAESVQHVPESAASPRVGPIAQVGWGGVGLTATAASLPHTAILIHWMPAAAPRPQPGRNDNSGFAVLMSCSRGDGARSALEAHHLGHAGGAGGGCKHKEVSCNCADHVKRIYPVRCGRCRRSMQSDQRLVDVDREART